MQFYNYGIHHSKSCAPPVQDECLLVGKCWSLFSSGKTVLGVLFHCIFQTFPTPREDWALVVLMSDSLINIIFITFSLSYFPQMFTCGCQDYTWENPNCGHLSHQWYFLLAVVSSTSSWVNEQAHRNKWLVCLN